MSAQSCVFVVDDDAAIRQSMTYVFKLAGIPCQTFESAEDFLENYDPIDSGCLVLDVNMPGMTGPELQIELSQRKIYLPIIFLTAFGDIPITVRALKAGAVDFLSKPVASDELIAIVKNVLAEEALARAKHLAEERQCQAINQLSQREMEILPLIVEGYSNKEIGKVFAISHRTVEIHRSRIMSKTDCESLMDLIRMYQTYQQLGQTH